MSAEQFIRELDSEIQQASALLARESLQPEDARKWLEKSKRFSRALGQLLRQPGVSVSDLQRYQSKLALVKSVTKKLKCHLKSGGGGALGGRRENRSDRVTWEELKSAFQTRVRTGVIVNLKHLDTEMFLRDCCALFVPRLKNALKKHQSLKVNAVLAAEFVLVKDDQETVELKHFNTHNMPILPSTDLEEWFNTYVMTSILKKMADFQMRGSGWTLHSIVNLAVNINKYNPLRGSSYVELPKVIHTRKACVNVQNQDNECFKWAVLSALHPSS